jgi:DeoR family fructose operon transcriptional repressor
MTFPERKKRILAEIYEAGSLSVFELAAKLAASPATIRRDLHEIAEEGLLIRTHGGAMKPDSIIITGFADKKTHYSAEKENIAKEASQFVSEGDTIFLDCGSTVFQMCAHLKKRKNLRVITNSLPIMAELIDVPSISINLIGGELDKKRKAIHGDKAVQHINSYHAAKCFIGVDGISAKNGLTAHTEHESSITTAYIRNAGEVFLLCDSSKIGKDSYIKFAELTEVTGLITDSKIDRGEKTSLERNGLNRIILASG